MNKIKYNEKIGKFIAEKDINKLRYNNDMILNN